MRADRGPESVTMATAASINISGRCYRGTQFSGKAGEGKALAFCLFVCLIILPRFAYLRWLPQFKQARLSASLWLQGNQAWFPFNIYPPHLPIRLYFGFPHHKFFLSLLTPVHCLPVFVSDLEALTVLGKFHQRCLVSVCCHNMQGRYDRSER